VAPSAFETRVKDIDKKINVTPPATKPIAEQLDIDSITASNMQKRLAEEKPVETKPAKPKKPAKYIAPPLDLLVTESTQPDNENDNTQEKIDLLEESLEMLRMEARQGITHVVATPHFCPQHGSPERFLRRRAEAEKLLLSLKTADPESDDARLFVLATVFMQTGRLLPAYQLFAEVSGTIGKTYSPYAVSDAVEALKSGKMNEAQQLIGRLAARAESPWKFFAASESVYALIRLNRLDEAFTVLAEIPRDRYTFNTELLQYLAEAHCGEVGNFKKNYTVFLEKMPRQISLRILELFTAAADAAAKSGDHQFAAVLLRNAINSTENTALKQKFARQLIASLSIADPDAAVTEIAG
jgi:hypothetical protein